MPASAAASAPDQGRATQARPDATPGLSGAVPQALRERPRRWLAGCRRWLRAHRSQGAAMGSAAVLRAVFGLGGCPSANARSGIWDIAVEQTEIQSPEGTQPVASVSRLPSYPIAHDRKKADRRGTLRQGCGGAAHQRSDRAAYLLR